MDTFFAEMRNGNPFEANRVVPSTMLQHDAEAIHRGAFGQLLELVRKASADGAAVGVLVWGEAGIGKSHLLARLGQWAGHDHKQALFVYLSNLQAEPEHLPRSLLRGVISILTRGRQRNFHVTPLFYLVNSVVRHAVGSNVAQGWQHVSHAYRRLVDEIADSTTAQAAVVDRRAYSVLLRFYQSAHATYKSSEQDDGIARLCVRWLSGDTLDAAEAKLLDLPRLPHDETVSLADDEQIKQVLIALAQLAVYRQQPLVLCFDQVDNLAPEQFTALARFLHALLDGANNLVVVTAGVQSTLVAWRQQGVIQQSTWDRVAQHIVELQRVSIADARQIVLARLRSFQEPAWLPAPVKELVRGDALFPLGEEWARQVFADKVEVRPRDVVSWAREGWRRQQQALQQKGEESWLQRWRIPPPPPPPVEAGDEQIDEFLQGKIDEIVRQYQAKPETLPPDAAQLAALLHHVLQDLALEAPGSTPVSVERLHTPPRPRPRPAYDLMLQHRAAPEATTIRTGVLCLVTDNRISMTSFLRRLVEDEQPPERLVLVGDERFPLDPGLKGFEYLERLRQRHGARFHQQSLTVTDYARLHALDALVRQARSGDLEMDVPGVKVRPLGEQEVIASHRRRQRYLTHPLLRVLLQVEAPVPAQAVDGTAAHLQAVMEGH
jgi:hypothetical protein